MRSTFNPSYKFVISCFAFPLLILNNMGIPSTDYAAGIATLKRFVSTSCIPSETTYDEHVAQFHGADRWSFECVPPVLEHLKSEAKTLGLWNLFAPLSFRRQFNSSTSTPPPPNSLQTIPLSVKQYAEISLILGSSTLAPEACNCSAPDTGNMEVLMHYGDDAQKQKYLPKLLEGKCRSAFLMTEPKVGSSDAMNIETKIEKRGNEYVINGLKWWSSGAQDPRCEVFVLMGRIVVDSNIKSTEQRSHSLHTMIIVPRHLPGVEMVRPCTVFGADDAPHGHAMVRLTNGERAKRASPVENEIQNPQKIKLTKVFSPIFPPLSPGQTVRGDSAWRRKGLRDCPGEAWAGESAPLYEGHRLRPTRV